ASPDLDVDALEAPRAVAATLGERQAQLRVRIDERDGERGELTAFEDTGIRELDVEPQRICFPLREAQGAQGRERERIPAPVLVVRRELGEGPRERLRPARASAPALLAQDAFTFALVDRVE